MKSVNLKQNKSSQSEASSVFAVTHPGHREWFMTFNSEGEETVSELMERIEFELGQANATVIAQDFFISQREMYDPEVQEKSRWPMTWVIEDGSLEFERVQTRVWAISGCSPRSVSVGGRIIGTAFEDDCFRYLRLGGLRPDVGCTSLGIQTEQVFAHMEVGLKEVGMDFGNVIRTWFFNSDILSWYREFNRVRNDFFRKKKVFEGLVPASTGVGGNNPMEMALTAGLLAVQPKTERAFVSSVPSPLQNSALDYGSSFSRAIELSTPKENRLFVSGTASIGADGETRHQGNLRAQIEWTLDVVRAILRSRDMDWEQVVRAHAYLRHPQRLREVWDCMSQRGLDRFPLVVTGQTICREDLLFEIELDALWVNA